MLKRGPTHPEVNLGICAKLTIMGAINMHHLNINLFQVIIEHILRFQYAVTNKLLLNLNFDILYFQLILSACCKVKQ